MVVEANGTVVAGARGLSDAAAVVGGENWPAAPQYPLATASQFAHVAVAGLGTVDVVTGSQDRLAALRARCSEKQAMFAELYVQLRSKVLAYRQAYGTNDNDYTLASQASSSKAVQDYLRELNSQAAQTARIDVAAILAHDEAIVRGAKELQDLTRYEHRNCRFCNGRNHKQQWIDEDEYADACAAEYDRAAEGRTPAAQVPRIPSDEGGYGYNAHASPVPTCPKCDGHGVQRAVFCDTRTLTGDAALAFKGIKETKNGIEVMTHDVDKAKDRLLKAAGVYGDDAASVARGAAAGAAAGAGAAAALRERLKTMSGDEIRKSWHSLG